MPEQLLAHSFFDSQLLLGLTVGGLAGALIGSICTKRAVGQYESLPTTVPPSEPSASLDGSAANPPARPGPAGRCPSDGPPPPPPATAAVRVGGSRAAGASKAGKPPKLAAAPGATNSVPPAALGRGLASRSFGEASALPARLQGSAASLNSDDEFFADALSGPEDMSPRRSGRGGGIASTAFKHAAVQDFCEHCVDVSTVTKTDDPFLRHYKKTGMMGSFTGMFGDKKTMYCHHMTSSGRIAVREAGDRTFMSADEIWTFLGKRCCGRYAFNRANKALTCGPLVRGDHDRTCNVETCLFLKNGLPCPVPDWAIK